MFFSDTFSVKVEVEVEDDDVVAPEPAMTSEYQHDIKDENKCESGT